MKYTSWVSNLLTIGASAIAIYLFIAKRNSIGSVFRLLINYGYQLSISELKEKLERLNDFNANDETDRERILNLFNEIIGQIRGNDKLSKLLGQLLKKIERLVTYEGQLTEARKRAVVSELRERLRHLNIENIDDFVGE